MLPLGLKIVWLSLSFLGTLCCWLVLTAFSKCIRTLWIPMLYCIAVTLLEGSFWLGVIWKMNPFQMPRGFCIAQSAAMGFSCFLLTGTCAASTLATSQYVLRPKQWGNSVGSFFPWRPRYLLPLALFPCLASIAQISVLFKIDIDWRGDDFACDVDRPEWVRFMSYAGLPFLLTIPSFFVSTYSAISVMRTHKHLERSRCRDVGSAFNPSPPQPHPIKKDGSDLLSPSVPPSSQPTVAFPVFGLPLPPPSVQTIQFPSNFDLPGLGGPNSGIRDVDSISLESSAIPTFAAPSSTPYAADCSGDENSGKKVTHEYDFPETGKSITRSESITSVDTIRLQQVRRSPYEIMTGPCARRLPPNLPDTIWKLILFQISLCAVQFLSSISTFIDAFARRETPTPFGTQHVALLLAAWGPVLAFGTLPVVRQQMALRCSELARFK